ncbi:MAG: biotin--[Clostridia bacterium]|nr:biotin--[acetyl-CoA-carboxylase] ligase [Clostridia bacterium]
MLKDKIIHQLEISDDYISGETLAKQFGVSRAAIWKAVKSLKNDGCTIDSVPNRGYRLVRQSDSLNSDIIKENMNKRARSLALTVLETVDSTNNEAKRMLAGGFDGNALIIANEQTGGRGRLGRSFYSPKNTGIYMTFLLRSSLALSDAVTVTTAAAVAVARAVEAVTGINVQIKWVNDVYANGKKVCGILTEAVSDFETGIAKSIIIGIGINITTEHFPDGVSASSLGTTAPVRNQVIAAVANELTAIYDALPDHSAFIEYYRNHSNIIGKEIDFYISNEKHTGKAVDIDEDGGLVVKLPDGGMTVLSSGEVSVRPAGSEPPETK